MKNSDCIKCLFLPYRYSKYKCGNFKVAGIILCVAYIIFFIGAVFSVRQFLSKTYESVADAVYGTDNFYMSGSVFHYEGERYQRTIDSIGLTVVIDPDCNPPEASASALLHIGPDQAAVLTDFFTYSVSYKQLKAELSDIDFDRQLIIDSLDYGRTVIMNFLVSTSILLAVLLAIPLFIVVLLISLLIAAVCSLLNIKLDFSQKLFIAMASLVYPFLIGAVMFMVPNALLWIIANISLLLRMCAAIALLYILLTIFPFGKQKVKTTE